MKATKGQPLHLSQRGRALPRPYWLTHSVIAPSGQKKPHQTRPMVTVAIITPGHHRPQKQNWANRRRLSQMCASSGGKGKNAGMMTIAA
jgi:hypothetical protein